MAGLRSYIEYRGLHPEAAARQLRPALKEAHQDTIRRWHRDLLPRHFKPGASARYRYRSRSRSYRRRKLRLVERGVIPAPARPLVFSGELRRNAIRNIRVSGTSRGARGRMPGTQKASFGERPGMPPMREEMIRTIRSEERDLARHHERIVLRELKRGGSRKRKGA